MDPLIALLKRINREIANPYYEIGITFFLDKDLDRNLEDIWTMEIYPYLEEYFFDQREKCVRSLAFDLSGDLETAGLRFREELLQNLPRAPAAP